jgi:hypothetical protein
VSIRGHRYWFAVVDVCTKLKLNFGAPTLVAGMKTVDYVLTRERNRVNKDISNIHQLVGEPLKLDEETTSEERVPEEGVDEASKELGERLSKFAGLTGKYEKLTVLHPRPMTPGVLRLDGAPNQRGAEIDWMAAKLGTSLEHPVPHDHRSMGPIEGYHFGDLKAGMASFHDAGAPIFMWCFFTENPCNVDNHVPRRDEKISPYALAHSHMEFKRNALALRCKRTGCLAY